LRRPIDCSFAHRWCSPLPKTKFNRTLIVSAAQIGDDEPEPPAMSGRGEQRPDCQPPRCATRQRTSALGMGVRCPGEHDRLVQDIEVAYLVGEDQNEPGVERRTLIVRKASVRLDQHAIGTVGI
jgi:hypothetical protein